MKSSSYQLFLNELIKRVPDRKKLTSQLMDLLCLEREAVYRRLRRDVAFSFSEIEQISKRYQISLDHIFGTHVTENMVFFLGEYDFVNTPPEDIESTKKHIEQVTALKEDPDSELGFAMNTIPLTLVKSREHGNLYKFALYKWMYQYCKYPSLPLFREVAAPAQLLFFNDLYREVIQGANYTYYVFDEGIISYLVRDIQYFRMVKLISPEEVEILKEEIFLYLDDLERLAASGRFPTGKRVDFFITQMSIEATYHYVDSVNCSFTGLKLFQLSDAMSPEPKNIPRIKEWLYSLKRTSVQISESGELHRIRYFDKQRELVSQL